MADAAPTTSQDPWFQSLFADRIGGASYGKGTEIYKFEKIKRAKRKALADHPERKLLDFGIGENDDMAAPVVREALKREADKVENRGYADNGIQNYKDAAAEFMQRQFGVKLDPVTEICHCIGSKPAYAMLPACFINPGDVTLMTVPGYPVAGTCTRYLGGEVHKLPLLEKNGFFPDLDGIPADVKRRAKLLVINYPNSPTGAVATTRLLQAGDRLRPQEPGGDRAGRGPHPADVPGRTAELPADRRGEGGRRRGPLDVEGVQHDRLAARVGVRPPEDRPGLRRREGQQRLRPVHGDPARRGHGAADAGDPEGGLREVPAAADEAGGGACRRSASSAGCRAARTSCTRRRRWRPAAASSRTPRTCRSS